ncbi:hypothetical protein AX16_000192 [Volvariella volvacea WC 439]|nr:hypothetical protein AX16_000192 [Volvariella volvacea WC 439]
MSDFHEVHFQWPYSEPGSVIVTGTFDEWRSSIPLVKGPYGFEAKVKVPWGSKVLYKFVVDGRWQVQEGYPTEWDPIGNLNNVYYSPSRPEPTPPPTPPSDPEPAPITETTTITSTTTRTSGEPAIPDPNEENAESGKTKSVVEERLINSAPEDEPRDITGRIVEVQREESRTLDRSADEAPLAGLSNAEPAIVLQENDKPIEEVTSAQEQEQVDSEKPRPNPSDGIDGTTEPVAFAPLIPMPIVRVNAPEFNTVPRERPLDVKPPAQEVFSQQEALPVEIVISAPPAAEPNNDTSVENTEEPEATIQEVHPAPSTVPASVEASESPSVPSPLATPPTVEEVTAPIIVTDDHSATHSVATTEHTAVDEVEVKAPHEPTVVAPAIVEEPAESTPRVASPAPEPIVEEPVQKEQQETPIPTSRPSLEKREQEASVSAPAASEAAPAPTSPSEVTPENGHANEATEPVVVPAEVSHAKEDSRATTATAATEGTVATAVPEVITPPPAPAPAPPAETKAESIKPERESTSSSAPSTPAKSRRHASWSSSKSPSKNGTANGTPQKKKRTSIFGKLKDIFSPEKEKEKKSGKT